MFKRQPACAACLLAMTVAVTACAVPMRTIRFAGTPADWQALSGKWRGEYWMRAYDRHGSIAFKLVASTQEASGDVLMISDRFGRLYRGYPRPGVPWQRVVLASRPQRVAAQGVRIGSDDQNGAPSLSQHSRRHAAKEHAIELISTGRSFLGPG